MELAFNSNFESIENSEMNLINGGGPIANAINATVGSVGIANSLAIGLLFGAGWGAVALVGGAYCLYNALD